MKTLKDFLFEAYEATYFKKWKPIAYLNKQYSFDIDNDIIGVCFDHTWNDREEYDRYGTIYVGMISKNEMKSPEVKLYSDKGVFTSIKEIQDAYNTTEKNLSKLVQQYKIKMSLIFNDFNLYTRLIKHYGTFGVRSTNDWPDVRKYGLTLNDVGKKIGKCTFETFSIVDIDLSNPDNNDAKYVYKNYSQTSIKKSVETSARKDGGRKNTGYCSFTFIPYHNYEDVETNVINDETDRNLLPALLFQYLKNTNITFDNKKISLSLIKNQLELSKDKYEEFKDFILNDIKSLNADVLKRHEEYLQSDDYKNAEASKKHDNYLLMTNGM